MTETELRFREAMAGLPDPGRSIAAAVSGGPDSMALAILLRDWARAQGRHVTALIVDHGIRAGSDAEAGLVSVRLTAASIPNVVLRWDGPKPAAGLQARARDARYGLMLDWCRGQGVDSLFVGHHADDQAATVTMRIARGSGIDGLGAMRPVVTRGGIRICRPLLSLAKSELIAFLGSRGLAWVDDPTNDDPRHERNRIDVELAAHPDSAQQRVRLNRLADRAARASDALQAWTDRVWTESAIIGAAGDVTLDLSMFQALPEEIRLRLLLRAAAQAGGIQPGLEKAERAVARLHQGGSLLTLTLGHALVRQSRKRVRVVREHRNLPFHEWLPGAARSLLWDGRFRLEASAPLSDPISIGPGVADTSLLPCVYRRHEALGCPLRDAVRLPGDVLVRATPLFVAPR